MLQLKTVLFAMLMLGSLSHAQSIQRIALLGCIRQDRPLPAIQNYIDLKADLHLWLGDNIYADTEDLQVIKESYYALSNKPGFKKLRETGLHMITWDDHDYGDNDVGRHYSLKSESKDVFIDFWGLQDDIKRSQSGIWYSKIFDDGSNKLQVIMLDVRYNRDMPNTNGNMLGKVQMQWLIEQLTKPADLRLIVSGTQVLLPKEAGSETWDQYPKARERLFNAIRETNAEHVIFITGDQHYGEACRRDMGLDFDVIELQFCGLNQTESPEFNPYRVSPVSNSTNSYAYIDICWKSNDYHVPHIDFHVKNADTDELEVVYRVNISDVEKQN